MKLGEGIIALILADETRGGGYSINTGSRGGYSIIMVGAYRRVSPCDLHRHKIVKG